MSTITIHCPVCGKAMTFQWELYGCSRHHDEYYGCDACDKCWEVKDSGKKRWEIKHCGDLSLSAFLELVRKEKGEEKVKRTAREAVKRQGGQVKDGKWLVLTESTEEKGVGFTHRCDAKIMTGRVAHPIWDGLVPCSGSGECQYENVPYCPQCEEEPDFHGAPIISA